jgi:alpha-tubulin suppressor-like RCC1 family protein
MKKNILILFLFFVISTPAFSQCWKSVSAGYAHILAIAENGTLWGWGKNTNGELGDGTNANKNVPVQIGIANNWKEVSTSLDGIYAFTLAVKTDGTLWAWGSNNRGQLGDGTMISKNYPIQIGTDTDWKTVATGLSHSIAIKENGTLWGWGCSERFALIGFPSGPNVLVPEQRSTDTDWVQASAHDRVTVAVKANHTVWGWGWNRNDMLNVPYGATIANDVQYPTQKMDGTNVRHTSTGDRRSLDIKTNNALAIPGNPNQTNPLFVRDIDTGGSTNVYIRLDNSTLWYSGIILGGSTQVPQSGQLGTANNWKSVSVGNQCAAAINNNGEIWVWGWNTHGQMGNGINGTGTGSTVPILVTCPSALSTSEHDSKATLLFYPNPVQDILTIESNSSVDRLVIIDFLGKEIINQNFNDKTISIDVSQFSKGLYFVRVFSGTNQSQIKFIKD